MKIEKLRVYGHLRRLCLASALTAGLAMTAGGSPGVAQSVDPDAIAENAEIVPQLSAFDTTVAYVVQFYPLWFTYYQTRLANRGRNGLVGPDRISPIYHYVVAINVDTLYVSSYLDLTSQPVILTIPPTPPFPSGSYSILMLDPYGDLLSASPPIPKTPGTYALIGPGGFTGTLPAEATRIEMPLNVSALIFRADKFSPTGENQIAQAEAFRRSLKSQALSEYLQDPEGGAARIVPEILLAVPFKTTADALIAHDPIAFLTQLQRAVASRNTPPFSPYEQALSDRFNSLFANRSVNESEFSEGAQAAHELILDRYLTHTDWTPTPTNWIHFTNIGNWGNQVVERSSITEFIQYANDITAAAYYHVFKDADGNPLDGSNPQGYVLTFPAGQLPEADRFWSVTAYTPEAIELVENPADKYAVASYTPGLQPNTDGSVSIYMAQQLPAGVPMANWLPIPPGAFNIMLRVYGPEGTVADNTYVPPGIQKR
ncbi:MAG: DUF1254 domain-containing protein [Acetobacteraceae bacterium]|nr:DUF1254 domain-containing protein [Acetobacteraceae bacterium]